MITGSEPVVGEQRGESALQASPATASRAHRRHPTIAANATDLAPRLLDIELHRFGDRSIATTPSGRRFEIDLQTTVLNQLLSQCDGTTSVDSIASAGGVGVSFLEVLEALEDAGSLSTKPPVRAEVHWARLESDSSDVEQLTRVGVLLCGNTELVEFVLEARLLEPLLDATPVKLSGLERRLAEPTSNYAVAYLSTGFDRDTLLHLDELCEKYRAPWAPFHLSAGKGWLGPAVVPYASANYRDVLSRRLCAADDPELFRALLEPPVRPAAYMPPQGELAWMLSFFFSDMARWLAHTPSYMLENEVEADPATFSFRVHPVLPLPDRRLEWGGRTRELDALIDTRTGFITALRTIEHHPSVPRELRTVQSDVADMSRLYPWANNTVCGGSAFFDEAQARDAAIGEAVERYCGNWVDLARPMVHASFEELTRRGERALDPREFVLYSEAQYAAPGFPFVPFTTDLKVRWVLGHSLTVDQPIWVPASFVYVNWYGGKFADEPQTNFLLYPGIAAGVDLESALVSAIEEVVERDATMVWWTNAQRLDALTLPPSLASLWEEQPRELGQEAWMIPLPNEFDIPVMAGVVFNRDLSLLNIGFSARPDPQEAARKAWTEALTLQEGSRDLLEPNGLLRDAIAKGQLEVSLKPWRADRRYLDDFRADFHDVNDLMCQQQVFLDPRAQEHVRHWVWVQAVRALESVSSLPDRSLATYRDRVETQGYEVVYVDVTTPDVAFVGLRVVRVLIPGLAPNFPAAFPFLGRRRIQDAPVELGWRDAPLAEDDLNYFPLPHA